MTRLLLIVLLALAALMAAGLAQDAGPRDRNHGPRAKTAPRHRKLDPTSTPAPPVLPRRTLDRQDQAARARRRAEGAANDRRPLLTQLPLTRAGVTIDLVGLDRDERHALLAIRHPHHTRSAARAVYRRALRTARDTGRAYRVRYQP